MTGAILKTVPVCGSVVYWNMASLSDRDAIVDGVIDLVSDAVPKRQIMSAARVALEDATDHRSCIVRPLLNGSGLVAMKEVQGSQSNEYSPVAFVKIGEGDQVSEIGLPGISEASEQIAVRSAIESRIESALNECDQNHVASFLANVIRSIGGLTLRPNGGVYYVPEDCLELFEKVCAVVSKAAIRGITNVFQIRSALNELTAAAVIDSLTVEVGERVAEIRDEYVSRGDKMSDRVRENRSRELSQMLEKVVRYEGLLQTKMVDLVALLEDTKEAKFVAEICS